MVEPRPIHLADAVNAFPPITSLTSTLKSYGISLALHASLVAALYAIPTMSIRRFTRSGKTHVISIEATQTQVSHTVADDDEPQVLPLLSDLDSVVDRTVPKESTDPCELTDPRELTDPMIDPQRRELPQLAMPVSISELPPDRRVMMKRRPTEDEIRPKVVTRDSPPRPKLERSVVEPPAAATIPREQFVGTDKESAADLSNNQTPRYPLEAVRQRLEGVVILQLTISSRGKVESVELIRSSGHAVLDDAALNAVATWQGQPAKRWGRPVESIERLPVRFRL